ncbi:hypothetical protein M947_09875 [Sulfurimonas hongkongensis]|uniref:Uncharacterized protein n=1 Tax=Sulfurimonas hongkongensis TaxID=1172190 RepID=T0J3K2_9BACT|nr:hypothetical protein [Sulfurimonas hongkongensis]EQB35580.1 hypothetical protein M947_09875 [Sulfurimonas hongkongensis]
MADDAEKTEDCYHLNKKGTSPFFYAKRYATKEKPNIGFLYVLQES